MPVTAFQYASPSGIIGVTDWIGSYTSVDEPPPFNDVDVMFSPDPGVGPFADHTVEFSLTSAINPLYTADGWALLARAAKNSAGSTQTFRVELLVSATVYAAANFTLTTTMSDFSYALTPTEAGAIPGGAFAGTWSLRVTAIAPSGSNYMILVGCCLQLPTLGFKHLIQSATGVGYTEVGAHYGAYLKGSGVGVGSAAPVAGSETTGAVVLGADGQIQVKA